MNREQMEAWLSLEGYEPVRFIDRGEISNHAARHPERHALSLSGGSERDAYTEMPILPSRAPWYTENDVPAPWSIFSHEQIKSIVSFAGMWDGVDYKEKDHAS